MFVNSPANGENVDRTSPENSAIVKNEILRCKYQNNSDQVEDEAMKLFLGNSLFENNYYFHLITNTHVSNTSEDLEKTEASWWGTPTGYIKETNPLLSKKFDMNYTSISSIINAELIGGDDLFFKLVSADDSLVNAPMSDYISLVFKLGAAFSKTKNKNMYLNILIDPYNLSTVAVLRPEKNSTKPRWTLNGKCELRRI